MTTIASPRILDSRPRKQFAVALVFKICLYESAHVVKKYTNSSFNDIKLAHIKNC